MARFLIKTETITKVVVSGTNELEHWNELEKKYPNSKITLSDKTADGYLEFKVVKINEYKIDAETLKVASNQVPRGEKVKEIINV